MIDYVVINDAIAAGKWLIYCPICVDRKEVLGESLVDKNHHTTLFDPYLTTTPIPSQEVSILGSSLFDSYLTEGEK